RAARSTASRRLIQRRRRSCVLERPSRRAFGAPQDEVRGESLRSYLGDLMQRKVLVTGGAGFIGSAVCRRLVAEGASVLNLDALTYAGNLQSLAQIDNAPNYRFAKADICDGRAVAEAFETFAPDHVIHLAAESHVDRSIEGGGAFIKTNVVGTFTLLEAARAYWRALPSSRRD